jgi:PAS domain S-box-containing protein
LTQSFPFVVDIAFQRGDVVFAADKRGRLVYWNKEAEQLFGYCADEVLGNPFEIICTAAPGGSGVDLPAILSGGDFAGGMRCFDKSGKEVALYMYATAGRDQSGAAVGVVFVARDVTPFWSAEQAVRTAEDRYRLLFEHSSDSVVIADIEGRVLEANPSCLRLYGYTTDEVRQINLADMVGPEHRAEAAEAMADSSAGKPVTKTIKMLRKDGTQFVADFVASVVSVKDARRILSVTRDVTERVRAEQATRESERKYRLVFESASDAVFIESIDGRILDANKNACDLLGYTKEELLKMTVADLVPADARTWLPRVTDAILRDGTFRAEAVNVHKSGRQIPVEIGTSTMELDGRTVVLAIVRDITKRRMAERALRESEERYRQIVNSGAIGVVTADPSLRLTSANSRFCEMLGYAEKELKKLAFVDITHPENAEQDRAAVAEMFAGKRKYYVTVKRYIRRDGGEVIARTMVFPVSDDTGRPRYTLATVEDVTERKAVEQALRKETERASTYLEVAGVIMIVLDETGAIQRINRKGCSVLGGTAADIVGRNWFDTFVPERLRADVKRVFDSLMRGEIEPVERHDNPVVTMRGEERLVTWHNVLLHDDAGRIIGTLSSGEDITARKSAEKLLQESEERFRRLVELSPDGVAVHQGGKLVLVNPAGVRLLGYGRPEELVGRPVFDLVHPDDRPGVVARIRKVMEAGKPGGLTEERFQRKDGSYVPVEVVNAPFYWRGKPAVQVVVRDISGRKELARAAAEATTQMRAVLANSPDGIAAECDGVLVYANRRFAELYGYDDSDQVTGRPIADFVGPEDRGRVAEYSKARARGEPAPACYRFQGLRCDSSPVEVEIAVSTYSLSGKLYLLGFLREVDVRRRRPADGGSKRKKPRAT